MDADVESKYCLLSFSQLRSNGTDEVVWLFQCVVSHARVPRLRKAGS